ncbi:MAG: hypothetical protein WBM53_18085 [Maribacter sp.]
MPGKIKVKLGKDLKKLYEEGSLTEYQDWFWFGLRPQEELYDIGNDPHQINNLTKNPDYAEALKTHREIMESCIKETDDKGQYTESTV